MKLHFKKQQYQEDAVAALTRVFAGQSKGERKEITGRTGLFADEIFSNKKLELSEVDLLKNVQELQKEQGIDVIKKLQGLNFTVEMETGITKGAGDRCNQKTPGTQFYRRDGDRYR